MPQQTSPEPARPVAGGEIRVSAPGDPSPRPPVLYEIWVRPAADQSPADAWVELYLDPDGQPVRLEAATLELLSGRVSAHATPFETHEVGVGVGDGALSMTLRQQWPLGAASVVVFCAVTLIGAVAIAVRSHRRASLFQTIARHESASREAERLRVAREIHDGPLQDVTSLVRVHSSECGAPEVPSPDTLVKSLRRVSADLRALATDLRPPALDEFGLESALEDLADRWARAPEPLTVRLQVQHGPSVAGPRPSAEVELAVYRIVQEALTNAATHGRAATAWIFLTDRDGALDVVVRDNGHGLPDAVRIDRSHAQKLVSGGHFGLAGMSERAQSVGGTLELGAGPGGLGTEVRFHVPPGMRGPSGHTA